MAEGADVKPGRPTRQLLADVEAVASQWESARTFESRSKRKIRAAFDDVRRRMVREQLSALPLAQLRTVTSARLSVAALERGGVSTVADVLDMGEGGLHGIYGVGETTVVHALGAARQLYDAALDRLRFRLDPDARPDDETILLARVFVYLRLSEELPELLDDIEATTAAIQRLVRESELATRRLRWFFASGEDKAATSQAVAALARVPGEVMATSITTRVQTMASAVKNPPRRDVWKRFEADPMAVYGVLHDLADLDLDVEAAHGHLPADIVEAVERQVLDESYLSVSLRGYQAFGAKYALVQRRTMLGDEMGLGKTVTALAVMSHLRALDRRHFLVICPASVLHNWRHEIEGHSRLRPWVLHGYDREAVLRAWLHRGGVAVTTFGTLGSLQSSPFEGELSLMVVDEAHYVKNPQAKRSAAVRSWTERSDRILFMTGTPLENRLDEFRRLVEYLQPETVERLSAVPALLGPDAFQEAVAPVYLRRNQDDVLTELPERIEMEDWVELSRHDLEAYVDAVRSRNFMAMRRAAFTEARSGRSAKMNRLAEVVQESIESGWKVVVFSYFRDVLADVVAELARRSHHVCGPITGSMGAADRMTTVREFAGLPDPAVLVSQIEAGGVGLNIQAASVVVLCEPQWKPSTEEQAIARCHRMGQVRPVRVHRLLATEGVDLRMRELLAEKSMIFDAYVRESSVAAASPSALDISETQAARLIVEEERRRLDLEDDPNEDDVQF